MRAGKNMKRVLLTKKLLYKFFILLITVNVSLSILPGGIIPSYGLFGEITSFSALENQDSTIESNPIKRNSNQRYKALINKEQQKVQYAWLLLIIIILSIHYFQYWHIFSNYVTPVLLKVRMNN
jgi:hypothetical protein